MKDNTGLKSSRIQILLSEYEQIQDSFIRFENEKIENLSDNLTLYSTPRLGVGQNDQILGVFLENKILLMHYMQAEYINVALQELSQIFG